MKILVAGFGNLLQRDDGFGVLLGRRLQECELPSGVQIIDVGIGGISMVQELMSPFDALVVLDAIEGETPGHVRVMEVTPSLELPTQSAIDRFADIHYAEPGRAIALASEMGVLPKQVYLVGCIPVSTELGDTLSACVEKSLEPAVKIVMKLLENIISGETEDVATLKRG